MKLISLFLAAVLFVSGCTTLADGTRVPDTALIQDLTTISTAVIVGEIKRRGLNPAEVLKHVQNARQLVNETPDGQLVNVGVINGYLVKYVPYEYQVVGRLIVNLIHNRVKPIIESEIPDSQKAEIVIDVIVAVLDGVEAGVLIHSTGT